ncbi:hypothetical protein N9X61_00660 [Sulfurimonas sp.]|nr:hypothetical protein [Sulfurimonas sp.]
MKFNQKINTIFLDTSSKDFDITQKVNVVLSPSLYWVKKVSLPLKYVREVKPLIPSLFEDILPEGNYNYFAYKKEEHFFIFAYEDKVILDTLKNKGISITQVNNVYFMQSEIDNISDPLKIDENQSICIKDELVILIPSIWTQRDEFLDVNTLKLSKNFVKLNQFGHIVNNKSLYTLIIIFSFLISIVAVEYFIVNNKITKTETLKEELFLKNNLKSTMMQNRSMLKEYTSLHQRQMRFREYTSYILAIALTPKQKLSLLSLKNNKLLVVFSGVTQGTERNISNVLKSKGMKYTSKFKANTWHLEVSL